MKGKNAFSAVRLLPLLLAIFLAMPQYVSAKMTDEQVVSYVKQATAQGKSQQQIGKELLARGVTSDQVERLKARFESEQGAQTTTSAQEITTRERKTTDQESGPQRRRSDIQKDESGTQRNETGVQRGEPNYNRNISEELPTPYDEIALEIQANENKPRSIFGHEVFNNQVLSFEPNENVATPRNYRLGPGDEVVIDIWGANEDHIRQSISPEGSIMVSQIGPVYLSGMTIEEAGNHIRSSFQSKYAGIGGEQPDSEIAVTLGNIRTIQVDIMGEVAIPGTYRLSPFSTVFHALYKSGGINDIGSMRNIQVLRDGRRLVGVDVYEYLFNGKQTGNVRLQEGDVIIVPPYEQLVTINGNVKRPMSYEMKPGETLAELIDYAGGFSGDAYTEQVRLSRQTGRENELYNIVNGDFASYKLNDGDQITVGTILDRFANRVEIKGATFRPGIYAIAPGLRTIKDLINNADGLLEDAFTTRAILYREGDDLSLEVLPLNLEAIMSGKAPDVTLRRNDVLLIPSIQDLQDRGELTISGQIANPGQYPFADNMTVEDLIIQAGGLLRGASTARIDVSRRLIDPDTLEPTSQTAEIFTFGVKDGLVVDGKQDFILQPYDIVEVRRSPGYQTQRRVSVDGEVVFDGNYTLQSKNERLSDVIRRAGGITEYAYPRGARLMRKMTEDEAAARDEAMRLAMQSQGADSISVSKLQMGNTYSVGIELEKALAMPGSDYDIVLKEGDQIMVPEIVNTVKISGDVMFPNTVVFQKGKKLKHYIDQAGGYGSRARKNKVFIVYMNGTVARAKGNTPIEPGCQIIVPSKPDKEGFNWAQFIGLATSFASLGTMAATISNLLK